MFISWSLFKKPRVYVPNVICKSTYDLQRDTRKLQALGMDIKDNDIIYVRYTHPGISRFSLRSQMKTIYITREIALFFFFTILKQTETCCLQSDNYITDIAFCTRIMYTRVFIFTV